MKGLSLNNQHPIKQKKQKEDSIELKLLKSAIGKDIRITYPHSKTVTGKLRDVNPTNLTLILEYDDGSKEIIPYSGRHIYGVTILGDEE